VFEQHSCAFHRLREYVQDPLSGAVKTPDGRAIGPPGPQWKGKSKPHRADRRWVPVHRKGYPLGRQPRYPEEFRETVRLALTTNKPMSQVAPVLDTDYKNRSRGPH
jgi:hypothetical protein